MLIENSFGILKNRFRQLTLLHFHEVRKIAEFIISCCVLHNLCIDAEDFIDVEPESPGTSDDNNVPQESEIQLRRLGELKREIICNLFN